MLHRETTVIHVTAQAASQLRRIRQEKSLDHRWVARIVPTTSGLGVTFAAHPEPDDTIAAASDIEVYVDSKAAEATKDKVLDATSGDGRARLVMRAHSPEDEAGAPASGRHL
jgi:Fe-S cluster assembly iron-binding protein IscA